MNSPPQSATESRQTFARLAALTLLCALALQIGCVQWNETTARRFASVVALGTSSAVTIEKHPPNTILDKIEFVIAGTSKLSPRSVRVLNRYDLTKTYTLHPEAALRALEAEIRRDPDLEKVFAYAEMAQIRGDVEEFNSNYHEAKGWYLASVTNAYRYLFDPFFNGQRNVYDPGYRGACDLYNSSLQKLMRIIARQKSLKSGHQESIVSGKERFDLEIMLQRPWDAADIEQFEFVEDYEVEGLNNQYHTFGLGVPMIAVRRDAEKTVRPGTNMDYFPRKLAFPISAFLRIVPDELQSNESQTVNRLTLELYDPLQQTQIMVGQRTIPLESDISTPLAYFLDDPLVNTNLFATLALVNANFAKDYRGLYMLEPYDPNRIPVVMVHGLWSSPITWLEMFNDLRAMPEIQRRYQFWFYLYPTGQPFWESAQQMRSDLARAQQQVDPEHASTALQQMVLVGHSMGGLVSRMQTMESDDALWKIISDKSFEDIVAPPEMKDRFRETLFFHPNPSISRVITIATPYQGSMMANAATRFIGRKLFTLPTEYTSATKKLIADNPGFFTNTDLLTIHTSVDSLAPDSPILPVLNSASISSRVRFHNIYGNLPNETVMERIGGTLAGPSDGVVSLESAHSPDAISEIEVPAEHSMIHQHPRCILEVRRILLEHLREIDSASLPQYQTQTAPVNDPYSPIQAKQ
jgi:hypothetical protein